MLSFRAFRHYLYTPTILLGLVELVAVAALAYSLPLWLAGPGALHSPAAFAIAFAALVMVALGATGLFQTRLRESSSGLLLRAAVGFLLATGGLILVYGVSPRAVPSLLALAVTVATAFSVVALLHLLFFQWVDRLVPKRKVLVLGAGDAAASLSGLRRRSDRRGFSIIGYLPLGSGQPRVEGMLVSGGIDTLSQMARNRQIDTVVVALDDRRARLPLDVLLACRLGGIEVLDLTTFFEREAGKIRIHQVTPSWLIFAEGFKQGWLRQVTKRAFDLVASTLILLLAWPVMLSAAVAIRIDSGRGQPILYSQARIGLGGRPFRLYKFRSMQVDAEQQGAQWASSNDPRVTRVGAILRKTRIDELPQLVSVFTGDMSFVGPRPERPEFVADLSRQIPYYPLRHSVKPGITGWAQLCFPYGASVSDAAEKLQYDLYYLKNNSLFLDLVILIQTVEVVVFGKGAR